MYSNRVNVVHGSVILSLFILFTWAVICALSDWHVPLKRFNSGLKITAVFASQ